MEFFARGLSSTYEAEHVARLFFPRLTMAKRRPGKSSEAVWVTQTKQWLWCAVLFRVCRVICGADSTPKCNNVICGDAVFP